MKRGDPGEQVYQNRLNAIGSEISGIGMQLSGAELGIRSFEDGLNRLPARIKQLRTMNYRIMTHLEKDQSSLAERWNAAAPGLKEMVQVGVASIRSELRAAETELNQRRMDMSRDVAGLSGLDARVSALRSRAYDLSGRVSGALGGLENALQAMEQDLDIAESSVELASHASFPWKEGESLVLSVNAEDENTDVEGVLTLTNLRFIYESVKEVVLKKTLFIATEKKKVREVVVGKPIGIVDKITKGRVGLLAGAGLYVEFKPESRLQELKLDVKSHEADWVVRFFGLVTSGEVDRELEATQGVVEAKAKLELFCPRCGAPYTEEIYRGQTSVQCRYCGTVMPIA